MAGLQGILSSLLKWKKMFESSSWGVRMVCESMQIGLAKEVINLEGGWTRIECSMVPSAEVNEGIRLRWEAV